MALNSPIELTCSCGWSRLFNSDDNRHNQHYTIRVSAGASARGHGVKHSAQRRRNPALTFQIVARQDGKVYNVWSYPDDKGRWVGVWKENPEVLN